MNLNAIFEQVWANKLRFLVSFFVVFTITYVIFLALDMLPEPPKEVSVQTEEVQEEVVEEKVVVSETEETNQEITTTTLDENKQIFPSEIRIDRLDKAVKILNPASRAIADLDAALLNGVVRHPDSATLNQNGNVFILGHSSYLPNVFNKNFQAFNGIQNLEWGDTIELVSDDHIFVYRVENVYKAQAQDVTVPIAGDEKILTIATCNSFGSIDDRYIVEAKQIEVKNR